MQARLADTRIVLKNAQAALSAQVRGMPLAGATIATQKQIFPKVTVVLDSVCEEEIAEEIPGPVKLMANIERMAIEPIKKANAAKPGK